MEKPTERIQQPMKTTKPYTIPLLTPMRVRVERGFEASREWGLPKGDPSFDEGYEYDL